MCCSKNEHKNNKKKIQKIQKKRKEKKKERGDNLQTVGIFSSDIFAYGPAAIRDANVSVNCWPLGNKMLLPWL